MDAYRKQSLSEKEKYYKNEFENFKSKEDKEIDELYNKIKYSDISEYLTNFINKYYEFLATLTLDQIVCVFNIIIGGLLLSTYTTGLSILLSDSVVNRIKFLEKYPNILKLLTMRSNINKKINNANLIFHFIIIIFGLIGNIFMFFMKYFI